MVISRVEKKKKSLTALESRQRRTLISAASVPHRKECPDALWGREPLVSTEVVARIRSFLDLLDSAYSTSHPVEHKVSTAKVFHLSRSRAARFTSIRDMRMALSSVSRSFDRSWLVVRLLCLSLGFPSRTRHVWCWSCPFAGCVPSISTCSPRWC